MLDATFTVTGKTLVHARQRHTIKGAGIKDDEPYAEVDPPNTKVTDTILAHIRKAMRGSSISLQEIQNDLN